MDELYTSKTTSYLNFASAVYCDRHLYISGGTTDNYNGVKNTVTEFTFKAKETTGKLMATSKAFPSMRVTRMRHSMMIARDHLFAFFGYKDNMIFSDTIEFLNLLSEEPEKEKFLELKIEGYTSYHVEPMIFPAKVCETLDSDYHGN